MGMNIFILPPDPLPTVGPPILPIFRLLGPPIPLPPGPPPWFSPDPWRFEGGNPPCPLMHTSRKNPPPPNRKREKVKGEKFANSLRYPWKWENGQKSNFPLRLSNVNLKIFSEIHIPMIFSPNPQHFGASFLFLDLQKIFNKPSKLL